MTVESVHLTSARVIVLGTAQDGGIPQAGCECEACRGARDDPAVARRPSCLGMVDEGGGRWLIDATPQFGSQLADLNRAVANPDGGAPDGIFLTHAHVGHYTGLAHLGPEVMAGQGMPLWVMPRMAAFLEGNQPWASLVRDRHVVLHEMTPGLSVQLGKHLSVRPIQVPHRDEFSETVAFVVQGPSRSVLWLPDIDRWPGDWSDWLADVDVAWLDGTFYDDRELPGRDLAKIPHPRISDHLQEYARVAGEASVEIRLIHLNHSNPVACAGTREAELVTSVGVAIAEEGELFDL